MQTSWHTKSAEEVLELVGSSGHGLTREEAKRRLQVHGLNKLPDAKVDSIPLIFLRQFQSPIIYILLAAALAVYFLGSGADAAIILAVLIFNAIIGTVQEGRAQNTLLALKRFVETRAVVMRREPFDSARGKELIIPDSEVVPGDIVILAEGEKIPADARIIEEHNLKIDESSLTGESEPVHKTSNKLNEENTPILEQNNMCFKGTHVVSGSGQAVVVRAGENTVIGKIAKEIAAIDTEIPLKANIRALSKLIIIATLLIGAVIFLLGITSGKTVLEMFATVVSIAVSVIPEGLPIAVTMVLATGVWRMSKKNALVKRLQAVEALGQARIIAVDKTGTLTMNEMTIEEVWVGNKLFKIGGAGYEPKGEVSLEGKNINPPEHPEILFAGKVAAYCANARTMFSSETNTWRVSGDPTEAAMFVLGEKLGFNKDDLERESPELFEIPFDYRLKFHTTIHRTSTDNFMTVVGAPEEVLRLVSSVWTPAGIVEVKRENHAEFSTIFKEMASRGLRVLAFAVKENVPDRIDADHIRSLTLGGFFGMKDAMRPEVRSATMLSMEAGMKVVMITGDHRDTAEAIAKEAGIYKEGDRILEGTDIDKMTEAELKNSLENTTVFARVTPEHKLQIIEAYKARGEIVAMTGDGVNDAPSLVAADLGVAMGRVGTEVAKEASDIVLLDDNLANIVSAVEEGRNIYKTIKKVVLYLISTSIGELLVITGSIVLGLPLPLLPAQIIWLNFVTDGFFTVALAVEPKEKGLLYGNFERPKKYLVDALMGQRMVLMAVPMMLGTLILFNQYFLTDLAKAWTLALTLLAVFQWFNAWNCRSETRSIFQMNPFSNRLLVGATFAALAFQLLAVYHPLFQKFLHTVPLSLSEWLMIISFASSIILVEEIRKLILWRRKYWSLSVQPLQAKAI